MNKRREKVEWNVRAILNSERVNRMTLTEEGAYRRALDLFYYHGFLPSDVSQLAEIIGKGCTIDTAMVVREMFRPNPRYVGILTHDYLEKLPDGAGEEPKRKLEEDVADERKRVFLAECGRLADNGAVVEYCMMRFRLTQEQVQELVNEFRLMKLGIGKFTEYKTSEDVRRNFMFYIPYSKIAKNNTDGKQSASNLNQRSATSQLARW